MAAIKWGKPDIEICKLENGAVPASATWIKIPETVKDSTKLTPTKGEKKEAPLSGGGNADVKMQKNKYVLEFELYAEEGLEKPVEDDDGIIEGEFAIRLMPENKRLEGKLIDRAKISMEDTFDEAIGEKWKYTCEVLNPTTGNQIKMYIPAKAPETPAVE